MSGNALNATRAALRLLVESGKFDRVLDKVTIASAGDGSVGARLTVAAEHLNRMDTVHGGLMATLVDNISSLATLPRRGVSVALSVNFVRPARVGQTLAIDARTLKSGKSLTLLSVEIVDAQSGELLAVGSHTKFFKSSDSESQ